MSYYLNLSVLSSDHFGNKGKKATIGLRNNHYDEYIIELMTEKNHHDYEMMKITNTYYG
jgi:hypothetical protein